MFKKGQVGYWKGKKRSQETIEKVRQTNKGKHFSISTEFKKGMEGKKGETNYNWKGGKVSYAGIHKWIRTWKGKPTTCEKCGKMGLKGKHIDWANKDHKYRRVLNDWIRLCRSCHQLYDFEKGFR